MGNLFAVMKFLTYIFIIIITLISCTTAKKLNVTDKTEVNSKLNDTIKIANEELEYEIIIIEPGFNSWLAGRAWPRGYYSEDFLESRNRILVAEWNNRVLQPMQYNPNLYQMRIDYESGIHYGYEVNYMLYNYFVYFQMTYNQKLSGFQPRP